MDTLTRIQALLPTTLLGGLDGPVTRLDVVFGVALLAFLVWLWLILR